jgi:serine/threonine-protein kinase
MLVGESPHTASTTQEIVARLLTEKPRSVRATRPTVPAHIDGAIQRSLEKIPADRWPTAAEFCDALKTTSVPADAERARSRLPMASMRRRLVIGFATALLALVALAAASRLLRPTPSPRTPARFVLVLAPEQRLRDAFGTTIALSPDGTRLAYVGRAGAGRQLYVRRLDQLTIEPLPGTLGAATPFFSPDGEWVGFFAEDAKLKKVPVTGGTPIVLADAPAVRGASWGDDDTIIFAAGNGLLRVSASGGRVDTLTRPDSVRGELATHSFPQISPGGDAVVFTAATANLRTARLGILSLRGGSREPRYVDQPCLGPRFADSDLVLCPVADGTVLALPFASPVHVASLRLRIAATPRCRGIVSPVHVALPGFRVADSSRCRA